MRGQKGGDRKVGTGRRGQEGEDRKEGAGMKGQEGGNRKERSMSGKEVGTRTLL